MYLSYGKRRKKEKNSDKEVEDAQKPFVLEV